MLKTDLIINVRYSHSWKDKDCLVRRLLLHIFPINIRDNFV